VFMKVFVSFYTHTHTHTRTHTHTHTHDERLADESEHRDTVTPRV